MAIPSHVLNPPSQTMPCREVFRVLLLWLSSSGNFVPNGTLSGFKITNSETCICLKTIKLEGGLSYLSWVGIVLKNTAARNSIFRVLTFTYCSRCSVRSRLLLIIEINLVDLLTDIRFGLSQRAEKV
jgi:hypothetical protein